MNTNQTINQCIHPEEPQYALRRVADCWEVSFEGRQSSFRHELGALYVAYLLSESPRRPIHGVAVALKAREKLGQPPSPAQGFQQRLMRLEDAESVRALWRRQRELERVLADRLEIEPVKAEALRELEEVMERLRQSPWLTRQGAERCARAVAVAIKRLHARLAAAVDAEGKPDEALRQFALHIHSHLLAPSGRGGGCTRGLAWAAPGCFIYVPPATVVWEVPSPESKVQSPGAEGLSLESGVLSQKCSERGAAADYLARFLCAGFLLVLMATGCAGPRPLRGGKAVVTRTPGGSIQQTLTQSENPAQATKQDQETIKVRTYTVPTGSRIEQSQMWEGERPRKPKPPGSREPVRARGDARPPGRQPPSNLDSQPSTSLVLSAPMPVVEREETRERTELGAAQKDLAREAGAKLASFKGIVWVGGGLFVFGLASLVWPPLKAVVGSVTTSAAVMLGGVALMVLPSLIVGNELLILGGVGVAVGGWFLAHRHGQLKGEVSSLKSKV